MRLYGKVAPAFWTGSTGKHLRALGRDAQLTALYLLTCPSASMLGLYYLPLPTLCHELGSPLQGALKALRCLSEADFAHYDEATEHVWVPKMARYQIAERLDPKDKRVVGIVAELLTVGNRPYVADFVARYGEAFSLDTAPRWPELARGIEGASMPHRSKEQEKEKEQEQEQERERAPLRVAVRVARAARATGWPDGFTLSDAMRQFALDGGLEPSLTWGAFKDYQLANGKRYVDWVRAWQTWCRRERAWADSRQRRNA